MSSTFKIRGTWRHGIKDQLVDVRALDIFLRILPWALAVEATVRGWEIMRITGVLPNLLTSPLLGQEGETGFGFEFFGFSFFLAGLLMMAGLTMRRFSVIIAACLIGFTSYLILSVSFTVEAFIGDSGTGARSGVLFLIVAGLWLFKGFFSASKRMAPPSVAKVGDPTKEEGQ